MSISYRVLLAITLSIVGVMSNAQEWPYPQDTPQVAPLNIGMASDRPVDISRFLLARGPNTVQMNVNGSLVAYISSVTGRPQVWLMSLREGHTKQLTFGNGVTFYRWHPDGKHILYGADNNGDEREAFYLISVDGQTEKVILSHSSAYRSFGDFDDSGLHFTYASTERNGLDFDIYVLDLEQTVPAKKSTMIYQSEFGFFPKKWQPNGKLTLVTETVGEDGENVYLLDTQSGKMKSIFKPEISAGYANFIWDKKGTQFYFTSDQDGEMKALMQYTLDSGQTKTVTKHKFDIENIQLCSDEQYLVWTTNENGFDKLHLRDNDTQIQSEVDITEGVFSLSCGAKSTDLLVRVSGPNTPGTVYLLDLKTRQNNLLIAPEMAGIDRSDMVTPMVIEFPARDGLKLQGLLYMPRKQNSAVLPPLVIDIHGGPTGQSRATWAPLTQYLLGQGIAVLDINVRGSTGFGKTYARLDNQEKRLDSVRDLVDALTWLKKDGRVDASRAAAMGGSYGGYMVNAVMGAYPNAFKSGASFVGVADWVKALQTASPALKASDRIEYGDIREKRWQDFYAANSPINTVDKITVPMFYEHGVNDPRDPVTESDTMVKALRDKGIPVSYLRFPDEGHGIRKLENRITFYRQLAAFLLENL
ncbi:MAG: dipeptidyl aminopeptidase/acylaminoacyl peptidase [Paraglaciecola sp.]|jgi:dipeptidyl aminopeptidase/acylaminoacyl peptidase